jgi:hypothetical protein
MPEISVDVWLYGALARYGGSAAGPGSANLKVELKENSTVADLLAGIGLPTDERGVTFINGQLSAMPGLQPDLDRPLAHNDRLGFFDLRSMWPFQYRHGAALTAELAGALSARDGGGVHHSYTDKGD